MEDLTLALGVIGALVGGAVAAAISAASNHWLARAARRDRASEALWNYHRALAGYAAKRFHQTGVYDGGVPISEASFAEIGEAFKAAYPWAGYLRPKARDKFFRGGWLPVRQVYDFQDELDDASELSRYATELETELERRFPLSRWS